MTLDLRPPLAPFWYIFGPTTGPAEVTMPGRPPVIREVAWAPSRAEYENVADVAVLDTMPTLNVGLLPEDRGSIPVGTRIVCPPLGETVPVVWTVRKVYLSPAPDAEIALVGVAR